VAETTGLPIHHYAEIDFAGFLEVVDALGGITLCNRSGRRLDDAYANLHMAPGCQEMNGVKALAFVRARHVDSDFGRIGRQQEFLRAVLAEVDRRSGLTGLPTLKGVAEIATDHIKTDDTLGTGTAIGLVRRLRGLGPVSLDMRVYPSVASPPHCGGCAASASGSSAPATPPSRRVGQASTLAYPPDLAPQARLLSAVLGGQAKLVKAGEGATLVLTVGSGFKLR
jgi:hypothetical protein